MTPPPMYDGTLQTARTNKEIADAEQKIKNLLTAFDFLNVSDQLVDDVGPDHYAFWLQTVLHSRELISTYLVINRAVEEQLRIAHYNAMETCRASQAALEEAVRQLDATIEGNFKLAQRTIKYCDLEHRIDPGLPRLVTLTGTPPTLTGLFASRNSPPLVVERPGASNSPSTTNRRMGGGRRSDAPVPQTNVSTSSSPAVSSSTNPSHAVRELSNREKELRQNDTCMRCGKKGHWGTDHFSYTCQTCGKSAPGHATDTDFCPQYKPKFKKNLSESTRAATTSALTTVNASATASSSQGTNPPNAPSTSTPESVSTVSTLTLDSSASPIDYSAPCYEEDPCPLEH